MAEIDVKFMKGDRKIARATGSTYKAQKAAPKKAVKPKNKAAGNGGK